MVFPIVMTVRHELFLLTEYIGMQVLVCELSICKTNLFFCYALFCQHAIDLFIEFVGRSVTFILHVCIWNENIWREKEEKEGVSIGET